MKCHQLAEQITSMRPDLTQIEVARLCLMLLNTCADPDQLADASTLQSAWKNVAFRLDAATDQHAAVSEELDSLLGDGPVQFTPDQLWTLLRAVKVQSQMLELYVADIALA